MRDTLTAGMRAQLQELREQFEQGLMDSDELSDLLAMAIDEELSKPDREINTAWLDACAELMAQADQEKTRFLPDREQESRKALLTRIGRKQPWMRRGLLAAACLLLTAGIALSLLPLRNAGNDGSAIAGDRLDGLDALELDPDDIVLRFGYLPPLPSWVPEGWVYKGRSMNNDSLSLHYRKDYEGHSLTYTYTRYEQAPLPEGEPVTLENGLQVILSDENGMPLIAWRAEDALLTVTGPVSEEELYRIAMSLQ